MVRWFYLDGSGRMEVNGEVGRDEGIAGEESRTEVG